MNPLTLIVVNDGRGDQCGRSYNERLLVARRGWPGRFTEWAECVRRAERWNNAHDGEPADVPTMATAVLELDAYYQRHLRELDAGANKPD